MSDTNMAMNDRPPLMRLFDIFTANWALCAGFLIIAIPTLINLSREVWPREIGAHGPIVLATGIWLLTQCAQEMKENASAPSWAAVVAGMAVALAAYIFGRAYDFISIEAFGLYLVMLVIAYRLFGARALWINFFPFLYLAFMVPPPGWVIDAATAPLRSFVSFVSTEGLAWLGYPIMRHGITIFIAQYQLLVEDACSGMNSIVGLTAISLFYIYIMHRASWRYSLFLVLLILPIAIFVNIIRVVVLILLTYYWGDAVAQGFLHATAGIVLFALALAITFGVDALIQHFLARRNKRQEAGQ